MRPTLLAALAVALGVAGVVAPAAADDLYPTDRCVADKLSAAAKACRSLFDAQAFEGLVPRPTLVSKRVADAKAALASAWSEAEATSDAAGVDCAQTTATADEVFEEIQDGVTGITAQVNTAVGASRYLRTIRAYGGLRASAQGCALLLGAESAHLLQRSRDRDRSLLERHREIGSFWMELLLRWSALGRDGAAEVADSVKALVQRVAVANLVSPNVPTDFQMYEPAAQVPYQGKMLEPICSRGTPWVYFAKRGTVNKLLVYYQGGGACWDYFTCEIAPVYKQSTGAGDNPANATSGFADLSNPENPFRDWNVVFVPYCTGDVHWGDATVPYTLATLPPSTIQHKGFVNAQVAEKFAREHFVNPDQVFVTGSSAGAYGALLNSVYLQEGVYPSSDFSTLGDAGNGVITQDFLENDISKWGVEKNLPAWIPALNKPVTELDASLLWSESAKFYPSHRFANYATAYDGGTGGQVGFYNVMRNPGDIGKWFSYWNASCAWNDGMRQQVQGAFGGSPGNYRYYIGSGARHTMWGSSKVYSDTTGGVPTIVSWVEAMLGNTPAWVNVETSDPGLLLPGDPRPNPAQAPYTAEGRIVCPAPVPQ